MESSRQKRLLEAMGSTSKSGEAILKGIEEGRNRWAAKPVVSQILRKPS